MNPETVKELKPGDELRCPKCGSEINVVADIQNSQPVKKGNIVVCGHCASICIVGDFNLLLMTKEEVKALDQQSKFMLGIAAASVLGKNLNERNKRRIIG